MVRQILADDTADSGTTGTLNLPKNPRTGKPYKVMDLQQDQKQIAASIFHTLKQWLTCTDYSQFKPLRMIINGAGGSGKSVIINTIVVAVRTMFQCNDVIRVCAPTGAAAANVGGETVHALLKQSIDNGGAYQPNSMNEFKRKELVRRFKMLLALIIDERSLLSSNLFGSAQQTLSETIYDGFLNSHEWGGLPVLILVGDDYQLPAISEGPLQALFNAGGSKVTQNGRACLRRCAENVRELTNNKRLNGNRDKDRVLLEHLRLGDDSLTDDEVAKLLSLHVDNIEKLYGKSIVEEIEMKSVFLFFRNAKRIKHNLEMLARTCTVENPVAIIKRQGVGCMNGKPCKSHFHDSSSDKDQGSAMLCVGCRVSIVNRNFKPSWGLYNRAGGNVDEIVFEPGANPNYGQLPKYVVVDFPDYTGPIWDESNPTVRSPIEWQYL